jgi:hypothetical protein
VANDEAAVLDHAIDVLAGGRNPYLDPLRPDHPLMQLPGSLLLAAPFHWAGSAAWQTPFWAALFAFRLCVRAGDSRLAGLCLGAIAINPAILKTYIGGSDYLPAAIVLLLGAELVLAVHAKGNGVDRALAALGLAVALSTHPGLWLVLPLIARHVRAASNGRGVLLFLAVLLAGMAALCLPFYLNAPDRFGLTALLALTGTLPQWLWIFPVAAGAVACIMPIRTGDFPAGAGLVMAIATVPPLLLALAEDGRADYATLAAPALLFALVGWAGRRPRTVEPALAVVPQYEVRGPLGDHDRRARPPR